MNYLAVNFVKISDKQFSPFERGVDFRTLFQNIIYRFCFLKNLYQVTIE